MEDIKIPNPIPFEIYYSWIIEFVQNQDAMAQVNTFAKETKKYKKRTGSEDAWDEDPDAKSARLSYSGIAFAILENKGWPSYRSARKISHENSKNHSTDSRDFIEEMQSFADFCAQISLGGFSKDFWCLDLRGLAVNASNPDSVRSFAIACVEAGLFPGLSKVELGGYHG